MHDLLDHEFWRRYHLVDDKRRLSRPHPFVLRCNDRYDMKLVASADAHTLLLRDRAAGSDHPLAWWDDARPHPFALRWIELDELAQRWRDTAPLAAPAPLLLLAPFVGFGRDDAGECAHAREIVSAAYAELGFAGAALDELVDRTVPEAGYDDYRWTHDDELGWTFRGEYPCYSLRNRHHVGSPEGTFPFAAFRELFDQRATGSLR